MAKIITLDSYNNVQFYQIPQAMPKHYYKDDDPEKSVEVSWRSYIYAIF